MPKTICPRDLSRLTRRMVERWPREECPACRGFSVNFAAVRTLMAPAEVARFWRGAQAAPRGSLACPHCRQRMNVLASPPGTTYPELDFCPRCLTLWFDADEWRSVGDKVRAAKIQRAGPAELTVRYADALVALENQRIDGEPTSGDLREDIPIQRLALTLVGAPVEEDTDVFATRPWITWGYATLIALALLAAGRDEVLTRGELFWGLLGVYWMTVLGDNVEDDLGRPRYLGLLAIATAAGALAALTFKLPTPRLSLVAVGSGLASVLAYYLRRFPHRRFVFLIPRHRFGGRRLVAVPALMVGAVVITPDLFALLTSADRAHSALGHMVGALIGYVSARRT